MIFFFVQAEDGIRDLVRSRGLGDVYKRQEQSHCAGVDNSWITGNFQANTDDKTGFAQTYLKGRFVQYAKRTCLLYTSDAADERSSVDLGGRRIIKKKKKKQTETKKQHHKTINQDRQYRDNRVSCREQTQQGDK